MNDVEIEPEGPKPISFMAAAFWTFAVGVVTALSVSITASARPGAEVDLVNLTACYMLAYSGLLFAMLRIYAPESRVREVLAMRRASPVAVVLSTLAGAALYPAISVMNDALARRFPRPPEETELIDQLLQMTSVRQRVVAVVSFAVLIPLGEALFFGGAIFGGLRRGRAEGAAVLATAVLFALYPLTPRAIPSQIVLGLLLLWLRGRSGSLVPVIAANIAFNAAEMLPLATGMPDFDISPKIALGSALIAGLLTWGAGMLFARDARAERGRLADA